MCFVEYDDGPEFWREEIVKKAKKDYECSDCSEGIKAGESYWKASGKFDGSMFCFRRCERCVSDAEVIFQHELSEGCDESESTVPVGEINDYFFEKGWRRSTREAAL